MNYDLNCRWKNRPCKKCSLVLGCPHSRLLGDKAVKPTEFVATVVLEKWCATNEMEHIKDSSKV